MAEAVFRNGAPCWADVMVNDVDAALAFYANVMGWRAGERSGPEFGGYAMWFADDMPVAGVGPINGDFPPSWTVYVGTTDLDASLARASSVGGQVLAPAMTIGPLGRMAVLADPARAVFGLWEAADFGGFARVGDAGFPAWFDVQSTDVEATRTFLRDLFGYTESIPDPAPPMADYRQLDIGGQPVLGSMGAFAVPISFWMTYFATTDVDGAAARASGAGGTLLHGPEDTPFGRMATLADPEGAVFSLVGVDA